MTELQHSPPNRHRSHESEVFPPSHGGPAPSSRRPWVQGRCCRALRGRPIPSPGFPPRGTLEVLDDYAYWAGKALGYSRRPRYEDGSRGPSDGTATVKFVALGQADMGFPSPGVFSFAIENGLDLVSVWNMGAVDVFNFAFRPGEGVTDLKELEGKTVLLGSAAWQAICDSDVRRRRS